MPIPSTNDEISRDIGTLIDDISKELAIPGGQNLTISSTAIINLGKAILLEGKRFQSNISSLDSLALSIRGLLELNLILTHVSRDQKALSNWIGQASKDATDIMNGMKSLAEATTGREKHIHELDSVLDLVHSSNADSGFELKGPFNIKEIAQKYGKAKDYDAVHKLCSKLIHPSSIKVNVFNVSDDNLDYVNAFLIVGQAYLRQSAPLIRSALESIGLYNPTSAGRP